jgi:hypothetical protein
MVMAKRTDTLNFGMALLQHTPKQNRWPDKMRQPQNGETRGRALNASQTTQLE